MANPICQILQTSLLTGTSKINKAIAMQNAIKKQADDIIALTDLNTAISQVPDFDVALNTDYINAIKNSCPGQFPDLSAINSTIADSLKDFLNDLKGSPLGQLSSLVDSLSSFMKPISELQNKLFNYLTCLRNICALSQMDFDSQWQILTNLQTSLNLDNDGNPQILDVTTKNILNNYNTKITSIKEQVKVFKI